MMKFKPSANILASLIKFNSAYGSLKTGQLKLDLNKDEHKGALVLCVLMAPLPEPESPTVSSMISFIMGLFNKHREIYSNKIDDDEIKAKIYSLLAVELLPLLTQFITGESTLVELISRCYSKWKPGTGLHKKLLQLGVPEKEISGITAAEVTEALICIRWAVLKFLHGELILTDEEMQFFLALCQEKKEIKQEEKQEKPTYTTGKRGGKFTPARRSFDDLKAVQSSQSSN